ncbi:GMC oxidoreductase [Parerythrobacter aestuarii]|uniref:GMC oxidoreductase n=1 Tax=Parerythrobacter aestuarii TaxID=3020909 RepID=UPI0024DEEE4E|nr:GMC oxidoreductase [Parerythrobacter aestuarii]
MILAAESALPQEADFVVIGGGTIGLPLARQLALQTGKRVLCLESGGSEQEGETHPFNAVEQAGARYEGAEHGRFRCLGGTSTRWGGALIPFQPSNMAGWPVSWTDLAPFLPQVEALFGLEPGSYEAEAMAGLVKGHLTPRFAKWPPFGKRNVWTLLGKELRSSTEVQIATNSVVTDLAPSESGIRIIVQREAVRHEIAAKRVIIAAGAIETTRLVWLLDRAMGGAVAHESPSLGSYFSDHLSVEVGRIVPRDRSALNRLFGFRFAPSGMMRNLRFERSGDVPGFVHVGYDTDGSSGFDHLRGAMQQVQRRRLPRLADIGGLSRNAPWLARAVKWRFLDKQQLFPDRAELVVHAVIEQLPDPENRITLSDKRTDMHGTPLPVIDWKVTPQDAANLQALADIFESGWQGGEVARMGAFERFSQTEVADALVHSGGIYHPTGSTRMGTTPAEGVVDADLCLFAEPRVQLCSTSVLPSGGGANPTMTALLLAMRLAAQHGRTS